MSNSEEYVKRAEECERLGGACIAESNREILLYAAARWRLMAEEAAAGPTLPAKAEGDELRDASGAQGVSGPTAD
jgi:hypothetical protein